MCYVLCVCLGKKEVQAKLCKTPLNILQLSKYYSWETTMAMVIGNHVEELRVVLRYEFLFYGLDFLLTRLHLHTILGQGA